MFGKRTLVFVALSSLALSLTLGMLDHETQSLTHLLTAERGNLVALFLFASMLTCLGLLGVSYAKSVQALVKEPVRRR